jgi:hypothetical protein
MAGQTHARPEKAINKVCKNRWSGSQSNTEVTKAAYNPRPISKMHKAARERNLGREPVLFIVTKRLKL